jgi:hypothetical protein
MGQKSYNKDTAEVRRKLPSGVSLGSYDFLFFCFSFFIFLATGQDNIIIIIIEIR